jgi:hypothetical protein
MSFLLFNIRRMDAINILNRNLYGIQTVQKCRNSLEKYIKVNDVVWEYFTEEMSSISSALNINHTQNGHYLIICHKLSKIWS